MSCLLSSRQRPRETPGALAGLACGVLFAISTWGLAERPAAAGEPQTIQPPELDIVAPPALHAAAEHLRQLDTGKLVAVMRVLGLSDAGPPITVSLVPEDTPVARQTPSWIAGFANGEAGVIVIFPARTPAYPYESIESLLHHEVTHVLVSRAAPGADIPRWFHEGLAMALEHTWGLRDRSQLALAVVSGERSLADLDDDFRGSAASAARAYGVAGTFIRDLIGRHGLEFPARLLAALAAGERFDTAFRVAASMPLVEAERQFWRESWWYRVVPFLTSSVALWVGILMLAIAASRRRAARRRALRAGWEAEDQS